MDNTDMAVALEEAIEIIEEKGWTQGCIEDKYGVCAVGAINAVVSEARNPYGINSLNISTRDSIVDEVCQTGDISRFDSLSNWNDTPGRTKDEVLDLFTKTAKRLRNDNR